MTTILSRGLCAAALLALAGTAAHAQETKLIMTSLSPPQSPNSVFFAAWAKKVDDAAKGAITVDLRDGISLATFGNTYDRTQNDVIQIGWVQHGLVAGKFPLSEVAGLPFVVDDIGAGAAALWRLYKSGLMNAEYAETVPLWYGLLGLQGLHFAKTPKSLDNLGGAKLRINGRVVGQLVEIMGGTPISMQSEDMYGALQRGTIDGIAIAWIALETFKLYEQTRYHVEAPLANDDGFLFMNKDSYAKLPAKMKTAVDKYSGEALVRRIIKVVADATESSRKVTMANANQTMINLEPAEEARWRAAVAPVMEEWVKSVPNGAAILAAYREEVKKVRGGGM